jgi:hypothetical protein
VEVDAQVEVEEYLPNQDLDLHTPARRRCALASVAMLIDLAQRKRPRASRRSA